MKRLVSFIVAAVLIIAGVFVVSGCEDDRGTDVPHKVYSFEVDPVRPFGTKVYVIDSMQTLLEMDEQQDGMFFGEKSELDGRELSAKMKEYDAGFFEDKTILFVTINLPHYEMRTFKSIKLVDEKIVVTIEKPRFDKYAMFPQVVTTFEFVVEVEKSVGQREIELKVVEARE